MTKRLIREAQNGSFESIMEMSAAMQSLAHATADHQEALSAFFEKRAPHFKGE
jgi:enoyl-CoA hydratase/carnithine racemase